MFVMVEQATGAFTLRCVSNDTVIDELRKQGALETFLADADDLYREFRQRFDPRKLVDAQTDSRSLVPHRARLSGKCRALQRTPYVVPQTNVR